MSQSDSSSSGKAFVITPNNPQDPNPTSKWMASFLILQFVANFFNCISLRICKCRPSLLLLVILKIIFSNRSSRWYCEKANGKYLWNHDSRRARKYEFPMDWWLEINRKVSVGAKKCYWLNFNDTIVRKFTKGVKILDLPRRIRKRMKHFSDYFSNNFKFLSIYGNMQIG